MDIFEFVNSHILDISDKIVYEGKYTEKMKKFFLHHSPEEFDSYIKNENKSKNNTNETNININNNSRSHFRSNNRTPEEFDSYIKNENKSKNNTNETNININNNSRSHYRSNNRSYHKNYMTSYTYHNDISFDFDDREIEFLNSSYSTRNNSFMNKTDNNILNNNNVNTLPENLKNYYLAQAYVFEDLNNSKLFNQIDWKNKANNDEKGEEITLNNSNKYKIKNSENPIDFTITSNNNKTTNIIVQVLNEKRFNYIKLKCTVNQWNLFNSDGNEQNTSIFALVRFHWNNTPEIFYIRKSNLNEII